MTRTTHVALEKLQAAEPEIFQKVVFYVRKTYSSYDSVSEDLLKASFEQNLQMAVECVGRGALPPDETMWGYAQIAKTRFDLDIPAEDIVASMRFSIGLIRDTLDKFMEEEGVGAEARLAVYRRLWDVSDAYTGVLVRVYRQHRLRAETRDHALKLALLARLRAGETDDVILEAMHERMGLKRGSCYRAFIATPCEESQLDLYSILASIDRRLGAGRGFAVLQNDTVVGAADSVFMEDPHLSVCFGPPAELSELHTSFAQADRVHRTSLRRRAGVHTYEKAGWRTLVLDDPMVLEHYRQAFEEPLRGLVADPESILHSVEVFIEEDLRYPESAQRLHCHLNTVRYRVRKFEEATGCSLHRPENLVALSWFLEGRRSSPKAH